MGGRGRCSFYNRAGQHGSGAGVSSGFEVGEEEAGALFKAGATCGPLDQVAESGSPQLLVSKESHNCIRKYAVGLCDPEEE